MFHDTEPTEIYTLSLHDALPIFDNVCYTAAQAKLLVSLLDRVGSTVMLSDRKSTRLNSSHRCISYAVFCLKKKNLDGVGSRGHTQTFITTPRHAKPTPATNGDAV